MIKWGPKTDILRMKMNICRQMKQKIKNWETSLKHSENHKNNNTQFKTAKFHKNEAEFTLLGKNRTKTLKLCDT